MDHQSPADLQQRKLSGLFAIYVVLAIASTVALAAVGVIGVFAMLKDL